VFAFRLLGSVLKVKRVNVSLFNLNRTIMRLYVGNLPWSIDDAQLKELFEKAGAVESATVMKERNRFDDRPPRSRGFGFVDMPNDDEAKAAIDMYNDQEVEGRALQVNEARPLEERAPRENRSFGDEV